MTNERYAICCKCENRVYAGRHGEIERDAAQILANFLEQHVHECDGEIFIADESYMPGFLFHDGR